MKKVLFFPQNSTHLDNFYPVINYLNDNNIDCYIFDTNDIYYQKLKYQVKEDMVIKCPFKLEKSFYKISAIKRINAVRKVKKQFISLTNQYDALVIGNDGALQRILVNSFNKEGKATFLIIDGIISNWNPNFSDIIQHSVSRISDIKNWAKKYLSFLRGSIIDEYTPSMECTSPLKAIFVIGPHSQRVVSNRNRKTKVINSGLPRYSTLIKANNALFSQIESSSKHIVVSFLTSAFKWHSLNDLDRCQHMDIALICEQLTQLRETYPNCDIKFKIKIHPRENLSEYELYKSYDFVVIEAKASVLEVINGSTLNLSNISTSILEGMMLGKRVYSLMISFPYWKFSRSFIADPLIRKIFTEEEMFNILLEIIQNKSHNASTCPKEDVFSFISENTENSGAIIAEEIINDLV